MSNRTLPKLFIDTTCDKIDSNQLPSPVERKTPSTSRSGTKSAHIRLASTASKPTLQTHIKKIFGFNG